MTQPGRWAISFAVALMVVAMTSAGIAANVTVWNRSGFTGHVMHVALLLAIAVATVGFKRYGDKRGW